MCALAYEKNSCLHDYTCCVLVCLCDQASSLCWPPLLPQWPPSRPTRAMVTLRRATLLRLLLLLATPLSPRRMASACRRASTPLPLWRRLKQAWTLHSRRNTSRTHWNCNRNPFSPPKTEIIRGHWSCWTLPPVPSPSFHLDIMATLLIHSAWSHLSALRE